MPPDDHRAHGSGLSVVCRGPNTPSWERWHFCAIAMLTLLNPESQIHGQ